MKYAFFFTLLIFMFSFCIASLQSHYKYVLVWPLVNSTIMACAYAFNKPQWIMGKTKNKPYSVTLFLLNLPWLLLTWLVWHIQRYISSENPMDAIENTNIYLARRLLKTELNEKIDIVVDLTSEFLEEWDENIWHYRHPLLDGIAPAFLEFPKDIDLETKILVHCAQGHGRTATYTIGLLQHLNIASSPQEAYDFILKARPLAKLSTKQYQFAMTS